jgi:hypothetical protein
MARRAPKIDPGLAEIEAWHAWFVDAHERRLSDPLQFPDRHLVESERAKIVAQAAAIVERMKEQYLANRARV